jgi:hypothetical protein
MKLLTLLEHDSPKADPELVKLLMSFTVYKTFSAACKSIAHVYEACRAVLELNSGEFDRKFVIEKLDKTVENVHESLEKRYTALSILTTAIKPEQRHMIMCLNSNEYKMNSDLRKYIFLALG